MHLLRIHRVGGHDGHAPEARRVQTPAQQGRVVGQAAVALILRHGHGHLVRVVPAALQCGDGLADDHLGREAGVVVDVFLAQLDLVDGAQRQRLRPEAVLFQHAAEQAAEGPGHVGHQHRPHGLVRLPELGRIGVPQGAEVRRAVPGPPGGDGLQEGLDPDVQGVGRAALVQLQNQRRLAGGLLQNAGDLVGQNGVVSAAEADDLHVLQRRGFGRQHGPGEHPGVEVVGHLRPGVAQVHPGELRQGVHRQHRHSRPGEQAGEVVAHQRVVVIGPPRQHHGEGPVLLRLVENGPGLPFQRLVEVQQRPLALPVGRLDLLFRQAVLLLEIGADLAQPVLFVIPVEHGVVKGHLPALFRALGAVHDQGIALQHRADVVALAAFVIRRHLHHHGHEDAVHPLLRQVLHMAVGQLGGEAHRVRGHIGNALLVELPGAGVREFRLIAQGMEERRPEGHAVPELQSPGQADGEVLPGADLLRGIVLEQQLLPLQKQVRG